MIALRSHNFFDQLHNPVNRKSTHNILLLLLYRDYRLLYQMAVFASTEKNEPENKNSFCVRKSVSIMTFQRNTVMLASFKL